MGAPGRRLSHALPGQEAGEESTSVEGEPAVPRADQTEWPSRPWGPGAVRRAGRETQLGSPQQREDICPKYHLGDGLQREFETTRGGQETEDRCLIP